MPRSPRKRSVSGIYHVMSRGIDKRDIFLSENDFAKFIEILEKTQQKKPFTLYAYCLMINHFHLLIQPHDEDLGACMQQITSTYALYHNAAHQRFGHLFQNRFKSEPINDDAHFLTVLRYIHQNPIKAGIVKRIKTYLWTSFHEYLGCARIVDTGFAQKMLGSNIDLLDYLSLPVEQACLDIDEAKMLTDRDLNKAIQSIVSPEELSEMPRKTRDELLRLIKDKTGASNRRLAKALGISSRIIDRVVF